MSVNGHIVVDMDSHVREYADVDRTYTEYIEPAYREAFGKLSRAVAGRREAGRSTALFMHPEAIIVPSDESRPLGVYDTFGQVEETPRDATRHEPAGDGAGATAAGAHARRDHGDCWPVRDRDSDKRARREPGLAGTCGSGCGQ